MILLISRFSHATRAACAAFLIATVLATVGCQKENGARGAGANGAPAPVLVGKAERKTAPLQIPAIGAVEPIRSATVRAQLTGTLFKIDIREGQDVEEGALLFEIDPRPLQNALNAAVADQQRVAAQLETARSQLDRYKALDVGAMVSQDQLNQIQANVRALEAQAAAAQADADNARLQLSYCSIRAPISGRTGVLNVHEGDLIRANDATALVTIHQLSPIYVTFAIPQQQLAAVLAYREQASLRVTAQTKRDDKATVSGQLTFVDNAVDATTGTIKLKAAFANDDRQLWPGQFVNVAVTLAEPSVITVPVSAIQNSQTGQYVFVLGDGNVAELRPVTVERTQEELAVIADGLNEGETVVTDGHLRVVPGKPVEIKPHDTLTNPEKTADAIVKARGKGKAGKGEKAGK